MPFGHALLSLCALTTPLAVLVNEYKDVQANVDKGNFLSLLSHVEVQRSMFSTPTMVIWLDPSHHM